ncbi:MAG: Zn-dependent hydrolase [Gemmatimonadaceae bacterium]|nr:Zn-dependent hydrolase [Gemmatimonadaceae bacterium]
MKRRDFTQVYLSALGALSLERLGVLAAPAVVGVPRRSGSGPVLVSGDRLNAHLTAMSEFGKNDFGGVSRVAYSDFDIKGRAYTTDLMRAAGLTVSVDAAGNIWGRRAGSDPSLRPIAFGSHIDSVPEGGNFDGTVGSFGAIEVAQTLAERQINTRHPLDIVIFQNEEGGTVGSRALVGEVSAADLKLTTKSGKSIGDGITFIGGDLSQLASVKRSRGDFAAYVELHIEQGGNLDAEKLDIGVVEGIVGIGWWDVTIEGFSNHAGTTPMDRRRDTMRAAAQFVEMVNRVVTSVPGRQVGTVGRLQAFPGAPNVIPGKVVCSLELRELDARKQAVLFDRIRAEATAIGTALGTTFKFENTHDSAPALCDQRIQQLVASGARGLSLTARAMPSGAGHDAQHMAQLCPSGMIFVPSVGGISHSPKEFSRAPDITNGANVLLATVLALDTAGWS